MKLRTSENIKKFRKEKEITQEQFAEMLGVSCQSVSRWESGICYPDIELLPTIAKILGMSQTGYSKYETGEKNDRSDAGTAG